MDKFGVYLSKLSESQGNIIEFGDIIEFEKIQFDNIFRVCDSYRRSKYYYYNRKVDEKTIIAKKVN